MEGMNISTITRVNRLSISTIKPVEKEPVKAVQNVQIQASEVITDEDINYSRLIEKNPFIESLVERFDLVSVSTGEKLKKTDRTETVKPQHENERQDHKQVPDPSKRSSSPTLHSIALQILEPINNYTKEDILTRLQQLTSVGKERAENGFNLMLSTEIIEETTVKQRYILKGSTPF